MKGIKGGFHISRIIRFRRKGVVDIDLIDDWGRFRVNRINPVEVLYERLFNVGPESDFDGRFAGEVTVSVNFLDRSQRKNTIEIRRIGVVYLKESIDSSRHLLVNDEDIMEELFEEMSNRPSAPEWCGDMKFLGRVAVSVNILGDCLYV